MKNFKALAPIAIAAAALALSACAPAAPTAYVPATITVVTPTAPAVAQDTITAPSSVRLAPAHPKVTTAPRCEEDQPCWNCKTMGNKICGPAQAPAPTTAPQAQAPVAQAPAVVYIPAPAVKAQAPAAVAVAVVKPAAPAVKAVAPVAKVATPAPTCGHKGMAACATPFPTACGKAQCGPFVEGGHTFAPISRRDFNTLLHTCDIAALGDPATCKANYAAMYLNRIMD